MRSKQAPVHIIDCTLREGEQTPGVWMTVDEKLALLDQLVQAGVRYVDAGMPEIGADEQLFLRRATGRTPAEVGASVRLREEAVQLAVDTGCDALYLICPCSPIHRESRLNLSETALQARLQACIRLGLKAGKKVLMVAEDAARTPLSSLSALCSSALDAGASCILYCDTVGVLTPIRLCEQLQALQACLGVDAPLGLHCHNDFGMATANTIAGIEAGIDWPTVCVNGVGERSGSASLAEVVLACEQLLGRSTGIDPLALRPLSAEVERLTGLILSPLQPIVGYHAFRHESGIHVDGILKHAPTYEPISPESVGAMRSLVLGKHSGRAVFKHLAAREGLSLSEAQLEHLMRWKEQVDPLRARAQFTQVRTHVRAWEAEGLGMQEEGILHLIRALIEAEAWHSHDHWMEQPPKRVEEL